MLDDAYAEACRLLRDGEADFRRLVFALARDRYLDAREIRTTIEGRVVKLSRRWSEIRFGDQDDYAMAA